MYASESAEPTMGIKEDRVNRTALVETVSAAVVIRVLKVNSPENTVITNAITLLINFESSLIIPSILISYDIEEVTDTPKNTLNRGAIR